MNLKSNGKKQFDLTERTHAFALAVIRFLDCLPGSYISQVMGKQLLRAATSIGANVTEAQGASSRKDFINFYHHALKSSSESVYWIRLFIDSGKAPNGGLDSLLDEARQLSRILAAIILKLKGKR